MLLRALFGCWGIWCLLECTLMPPPSTSRMTKVGESFDNRHISEDGKHDTGPRLATDYRLIFIAGDDMGKA